MGISHGDGTLHMGFDQHDNPLVYRVSKPGLATDPTKTSWSADSFGPVLVGSLMQVLKGTNIDHTAKDYLPGLEDLDKSTYFINVTYPRFLSFSTSQPHASGSDLLLELRVGRSGLGDDWLYRYTPNKGWSQIGKYLEVKLFLSQSLAALLTPSYILGRQQYVVLARLGGI